LKECKEFMKTSILTAMGAAVLI